MELPDAKIRETTVIPDEDGLIVRLQIYDGELEPPSYSINLVLSVQIPLAPKSALAKIEHDTLDFADSVLAALVRQKKEELGLTHR
ncbi:MAG: hypothetical protein KGJ79_13420 [Alphaproteobacteria bacterium]|nr:hypothetical protein [Alphaproteobacteria bacterium]MDE2492409.1 hypothetical protein [Alphaproteobacteria bacterium]